MENIIFIINKQAFNNRQQVAIMKNNEDFIMY